MNSDLDINDKLSPKEQEFLKNINSKANSIQKDISKSTDFFNLSITQILHNWAKNMNAILSDLSSLSYSNFQLNSDPNLWWQSIISFLQNLLTIIRKDDRLIYFGISLIFISLALFSISLTS